MNSPARVNFLFFCCAAIMCLSGTSTLAQGWTAVSPLPGPPTLATGHYTPPDATPYLRTWTKPVYDDNDQGLLVYFANPDCCNGTFSNAIFLYRLSTNTWTLLWSHMTTATIGGLADAPDAPADNHPYHGMAWDSTRGVLWKAFGSAQVGGETGNCGDCSVSDTYKFDTATSQGVWTEVCGNTLTACPPGPLQESTLAYDPVHDTLVLYGGLSGGTPTADTWEFTPRNNTWTQICGLNAAPLAPCGPPQLDAPGLVYDAALGKFVLFSGQLAGSGSPMNTTTWLYNVATHQWAQVNSSTNPPGSKFPVMDYVPRLAAVVLIGSESTGAHTWAFNGAQWIDLNLTAGPVLSTTARENQGAYDVSADRFVLFLPGANQQGDIWSLDLPPSLNIPPPTPGPAATVSQASVSFATEPVGTVSPVQRLTVTSTGTSALTISSITTTGTNSGDFAQTNTCPASPNTLAVGASCTVGFTFKPSTIGTESALASISDNISSGSPQVVVLEGTGIANGPVGSFSPTALAFGNQPTGTTSAPQSLTLRNTGNAAMTINSITISGTNSADFAQTNNCPIAPGTLTAGGSCVVTVTFTPTTAGNDSALVNISASAAQTSQSASVTGTGTSNGGGGSAQFPVGLVVQEAIYSGVSGVDRTQDPVTVGIPLSDAAGITDTSSLGLTGASVGQFRVLARWPSGNIKWVLVDTLADVPAGGQSTGIALTTGSGNFGGPDLAVDQGRAITVDTGSATFTLRKANFNLLDQVVVNGRTLVAPGSSAGMVLVGPTPGNTICPCSTVYSSSNDPDSTAVIEENGPVRAVIKATGQHKDSDGHAYLRFTVRLYFYKNKTYMKVVSLLQNADYGESNTLTSAYKGFAAYELRITPSLETGRSFNIGTSQGSVRGSFEGREDVYLYQGYSNKMEDCGWVAPDPRTRFAPRSYVARKRLTNKGCRSEWSYSQEGYKAVRALTVLASGNREQYPEGWANLEDASGAGIEVGVYQLAAYWPKSLQFMGGGGEVGIGIWPDQSLFGAGGQQYIQAWPQYSLHTLYVNFHSSSLPSASAEFRKFQFPLLARADRSAYNTSKVFFYPILDPKEEDRYYRSLGVKCCIADIGSPHIFRTYAWPAGGGGNQAEMRWANLMLWLERGFVARYLDAAHFYTFQTEQVFPRSDYRGADTFHWRDSSIPSSALAVDGFPDGVSSRNSDLDCDPDEKRCGRNWIDVQHAHWYGMIDYYFMSGDESIKDAIEAGASDVYGNPQVGLVRGGNYWNSRDIGAALMSDARLYFFYSSLGDSTDAASALAAGDLILGNQVWPSLEVSGFGNSKQGVSRTRGFHFGCCGGDPRFAKPFQQGILSEGLWEFLQAHGEAWPRYEDTFDLAYAIGKFTLTEGWRSGGPGVGCTKNSGPAYDILVDQPNMPLLPSCSQTVWFTFHNVAEYTGDWNVWGPQFAQYLQHLNGNGSFYAEYGTIFASAVVDEVLHRKPETLVSVPLTVANLGGGSYSLSWIVPTGTRSYRIKYASKEIVEWLNFDPSTDSFGVDPHSNIPWFACTNVPNVPAPSSPGSTQSFTVTGLDPSQSWNFALKASVPAPVSARAQRK